MTDVTIQLSEAAATELAEALQVPAPETVIVPARANVKFVNGAMTTPKNQGFAQITRYSLGIIQFFLATPMPDANYMVTAAGSVGPNHPAFRVLVQDASIFSVACYLNGVLTDPVDLQVKVDS